MEQKQEQPISLPPIDNEEGRTRIIFYVEGIHPKNQVNVTQANYSALEVKGHTKTSVCNAISSLVWTLAGTLANLVPGQCNLDEKDDHMFISVQVTSQAHVNLVFETIYVGLQQLKQAHPDEIMDIEFMIPPLDEEEGNATDEDPKVSAD